MIAATLQLTTLPTDFWVWFVSTLIGLVGAVMRELWARARIASLETQLAACHASASPVYRDELPTAPGAFWLRDRRGHESLRLVIATNNGELRVDGASRLEFFANSGFQWAGPLPWPREE